MPTVIDSISIEIESNSAGASRGIDALAESLSKLKKNGSVGVAVKNLKELSGALKGFTDASHVSRTVGKVAGALGKLKEVGSVKSIANSIGGLNAALQGVEKINVDALAPQLERISAAVAPLSSVKAGGIHTMANGLLKLKEVTEKLDDDTIVKFAQRVELVSQKLTPLSEKMTTIRAGFSGINSSARKAGDGVKHFGTKLNKTTINASAFIHILESAVRLVRKAVHKFAEFIGDAAEWEGISARFGRGFGPQAQETYEWIQKLNQEMGINTQQFMQYSSTYATMLKGFGVAQEDASKMALGYMELTYDIWAGFNDQYKSLEDAADAVRSAIAGEVEPVRRAGFTIIESTLEQTAANHGLKISLENATEAQKSYLRYQTLVDQAQAQNLVGTYAKEMNTAEGVIRTLSQQVRSLAQSFASLFLPILVQAVPYIQAVVDLAKDAVYWLAKLLGIEIQAVDFSGYNSGINGAVEGTEALGDAAKEAKKQLMGIDELTVLQDNKETGPSGGSGFESLPVDSLWDQTIFDNIQSQVGELKEKLKPLLGIVGTIGAAFLAWKIGTLIMPGIFAISNLLGSVMGKVTVLTPAAAKLATALKFAGAVAVVAGMVARFVDLWNHSENFRIGVQRVGEVVNGVFSAAKDVLGGVGVVIGDIAIGFVNMLPESAREAIKNGIVAISDAIGDLDLDWKDLALTIGGIALLFVPGGQLLGTALLAFEALTVGLRMFGNVSDEEWAMFKETWQNTWNEVKAFTSGVWEAVKENFKLGLEGIIGFVVGFFTSDWKTAWDGLTKIAKSQIGFIDGFANALFGKDVWRDRGKKAMEGLLNGLKALKQNITDFFNSLIPDFLKTGASSSSWTGNGINPVKMYASGGYPDTGELFVARENGIPEMVGRMGSRTAVANNYQIVEGVAAGVESANEDLIAVFYAVGKQIVDAINSKDTATYIDTRKITAAQTQRSRAYGV